MIGVKKNCWKQIALKTSDRSSSQPHRGLKLSSCSSSFLSSFLFFSSSVRDSLVFMASSSTSMLQKVSHMTKNVIDLDLGDALKL